MLAVAFLTGFDFKIVYETLRLRVMRLMIGPLKGQIMLEFLREPDELMRVASVRQVPGGVILWIDPADGHMEMEVVCVVMGDADALMTFHSDGLQDLALHVVDLLRCRTLTGTETHQQMHRFRCAAA